MAQTSIIYARFSTADQRHGFSLERQKTLGIEFATERGWAVEAVISDEGKSAFHAANRAEGAALHQFELEARNGLHKGKVLVVENIDRLSRQGAKATAQLVWALNEQGVDVATYHDGTIYSAANNGDMMELFSVIIKAQVAYEESLKKSQRTKATWVKRYDGISSGNRKTMAGRAPSWIDRVGDHYELNAHRTAVLNEIFDWYISGIGIYKIVQMLNERKEPTWHVKKGDGEGGWYLAYVWRLLTKRAVLGEYVTLKNELISANFFPQAVSAEKFNQAQAILQSRKGTGGHAQPRANNLLSNIVYCFNCGKLAAYEHKGRESEIKIKNRAGEIKTYKRKVYSRLRCSTAVRKHTCDNDTLLDYDIVEKTVLEGMLPLMIKKGEDPAIGELRDKIAEEIRLRDGKAKQLENILDAIANGGAQAFVQRANDIEADIAAQDAQIRALQQSLDVLAAKPAASEDTALIERLRADLNETDPDKRLQARRQANITLKRLIHRIDIEIGTFRIYLNDTDWYLFDKNGIMLEAQQRL